MNQEPERNDPLPSSADRASSPALSLERGPVGERKLMAIPPRPERLEDTGLNRDLILQLMVKTLYYGGELTGAEVAERLRLPYLILDELFQFLRNEKLCEVKGVAGIEKSSYRYGLSSLGRERAREYLEISHYVGAAPVPLDQYTEIVKKQSLFNFEIDRETLLRGLSHLVVPDQVVDELGPAINSGHSIFIYGAPGNGKSIISEAVGLAFAQGGEIFIPHALEVGGQIIKVFNPVDHVPVEDDSPNERSSAKRLVYDRRWILCQRPTVFVGGELTLDMLDLHLNPISKYYEAPPQMKANGGVFIIDDLGRQLVRPRDLLNRWIVPLEKRVDYFTLHTGEKFPVPFDTLVIFATNIEPEELVDEAFFRRIRFKVRIHNPTQPMYEEIFRRYCEAKGLDYDPEIVRFLWDEYYRKYNLEPRSCHPRDLIDQVISIAKFTRQPIKLTKEMMVKACRSYFVVGESAEPIRLEASKKPSEKSWTDLVTLFEEMVDRTSKKRPAEDASAS
ncbi:MAG TPA: ATP-binding protein [Blastocatellia bacterium]|nr:ATP-binding protein [Blastocatellia bacterium]